MPQTIKSVLYNSQTLNAVSKEYNIFNNAKLLFDKIKMTTPNLAIGFTYYEKGKLVKTEPVGINLIKKENSTPLKDAKLI